MRKKYWWNIKMTQNECFDDQERLQKKSSMQLH